MDRFDAVPAFSAGCVCDVESKKPHRNANDQKNPGRSSRRKTKWRVTIPDIKTDHKPNVI